MAISDVGRIRINVTGARGPVASVDGEYLVTKSQYENGFNSLAAQIAVASQGITIVADDAARNAFYDVPENRSKLVYENNNNGSATDPANGVYEYVNGSSRFAQGFYAGLSAVVQPLVDQTEDARDEAVKASQDTVALLAGSGLVDSSTFGRSPYMVAFLDGLDKLLFGIRKGSGSLAYLNIGGRVYDPIEASAYDRSGYDFLILDANDRIVYGYRPPVAATTDYSDRVILSQVDATGKQQVYSENLATGSRIQLSPSGSNNVLSRTTRSHAIYASDRASPPPGGLFAAPLGGGAEVPVLPYKAIAMYGDSQVGMGATDGTGAGIRTAVALGWSDAVQFGVGGQTATQAASRLVSVELTIAGGVIPASGSVGATILGQTKDPTGPDPITGGEPVLKIRYMVAGVSMILTRDTSGSGDYTLTRETAGSAVSAPGLVTAYALGGGRSGDEAPIAYPRDRVTIIQLGRNGRDFVDANIAGIKRIIATLTPLSKRFVIPLVLPVGTNQDGSTSDPIEPTGSQNRARVERMNAAIRAAFPDNFIDLLPILQAHGDGSANDNSDISNGYTPRSLRTDFLHLNAAGRQIAAQYGYAPFIINKGWNL
jgi:hypothetical protein